MFNSVVNLCFDTQNNDQRGKMINGSSLEGKIRNVYQKRQ